MPSGWWRAELLCAAQGLEFLKPLRPGAGVEALYRRLRELTPAVAPLDADRPPAPDLERLARAVAAGELDPGRLSRPAPARILAPSVPVPVSFDRQTPYALSPPFAARVA